MKPTQQGITSNVIPLDQFKRKSVQQKKHGMTASDSTPDRIRELFLELNNDTSKYPTSFSGVVTWNDGTTRAIAIVGTPETIPAQLRELTMITGQIAKII